MAQARRLQDRFPIPPALVIGHWIVDFASTKVHLVVDVDGPYHEDHTRPDAARDRALRNLGWHVVRVTEQDVINNLDAVVAHIAQWARPRSP